MILYFIIVLLFVIPDSINLSSSLLNFILCVSIFVSIFLFEVSCGIMIFEVLVNPNECYIFYFNNKLPNRIL